WRLVAVLMVLGLAAGVGSYYVQVRGAANSGVKYYRATHTLVGTKETNLDQMATVATESEIARRVAERLGGSPSKAVANVVAEPDPSAQDGYRQAKDDIVKQDKDLQTKIAQAQQETATTATLSSLSTAEPSQTTEQVMNDALNVKKAASKTGTNSSASASSVA